MEGDIGFRIVFFILLAGMLGVRMTFNLRLRRHREQVMPDREAISREGWGLFMARCVMSKKTV